MLPTLAQPPASEPEHKAFDFAHYQDHLEIVQAINKSLTLALPIHAIHPAIDKGGDWKRMHQALHDGMNKALALSQSQDFTGEMDHEWHNSNYNEHLAARTKLGI